MRGDKVGINGNSFETLKLKGARHPLATVTIEKKCGALLQVLWKHWIYKTFIQTFKHLFSNVILRKTTPTNPHKKSWNIIVVLKYLEPTLEIHVPNGFLT